MLYGTSDSEPQTEYVVAQLSQELYNSNLLLLLIQVYPYRFNKLKLSMQKQKKRKTINVHH